MPRLSDMRAVLPAATDPDDMPGRKGPAAATQGRSGVGAAVAARLVGPGGLYNLGNVIALLTGITLQFAATDGLAGDGIGGFLSAYFFGSPGASWLTMAICIFLVSGETYHRAWQGGPPPDLWLNRAGDLLSALGAAALTVALVHFGDLMLALVSGTLLVGGKLGTAILPERDGATGGACLWTTLCRRAVVASRLPAILALTVDLASALAGAQALTPALLGPAVMILCHLIWIRADLLLMRPRP